MKFYICEHCGNIVTFLQSSGVPVMCCGQKMTELVPDSTDAAQEKHVPVVTVEGSMVDVKVGSAPHPMIPEHYIQWVALETTEGCQIKYLEPGQAPEVKFALAPGDRVKAAYGRPLPMPPACPRSAPATLSWSAWCPPAGSRSRSPIPRPLSPTRRSLSA